MPALLDTTYHTAPFPELLEEPQAFEGLSLRPFGILPEDRDVNFHQTSRPNLETQILQCCTCSYQPQPLPPDFFWNLNISTRTACLLLIAALGEGTEDLMIDLRCWQPDCREEMEVELTREEMASLLHPTGKAELIEISLGKQTFALRRPTGADQMVWLSQSFADEPTAIQAMVQRLLPEEQWLSFQQAWKSQADLMQVVNQAMEEMDPLVNFKLQVQCPGCGTESAHAVDLGDMALRKLRQAQDQLLEKIYRLASHFHWTEDVIFALPPWRRERYLRFIEQEADR
jgi:hypothetical protein